MEKLYFDSDYMEGAHPLILEKLMQTNLEKTTGYGTDPYCESAREKIRKACGMEDAEVFFLVGGTQTNTTVIDSLLRNYEGVIAVDSGHVSVHEAGAIEATGHKVIQLPGQDGKLQAETLEHYLTVFHADANNEHMVYPGMVYISFPTELGTLYTKEELEQIHKVCRQYQIPLFVDGARLGYGLAAEENTMTLSELATACDVFYIGGTKVGALFGEAVVVTPGTKIPHFFTMIKQHGGLLAKGRLLGIQFDTLFTDDLYLKISGNAIIRANRIKELLVQKGYKLFLNSPTNQIFVELSNDKIKELEEKVSFSFWEAKDENHTIVRFCTSWATTSEEVETLGQLL